MTRELELLDRVESGQPMAHADWQWLLEHRETMDRPALYNRARAVREREFGFGIHTRGLIEISSFCKNDCYYCGLRRSNAHASRYRLTKEQILDCCETGWKLGFRTFVLQGGEDAYYTDERMCDIVSEIHRRYPEAAITLSLGERSEESYRRLKEAGGRSLFIAARNGDGRPLPHAASARTVADTPERMLVYAQAVGLSGGRRLYGGLSWTDQCRSRAGFSVFG